STQARVKAYYTSSPLPIDQMTFEDGTVWGTSHIQSLAYVGEANQLTGTASADVFIIDNTLDTITEAADGVIDEVRSSVSYLLPSNVENFTATGVLNLSIQGNYANNILRGNVNNNEFRTGGGNDTAYGGLGDDTYYIDSGVLNVQENAGEGIDTLFQVDASWATGGSPYASDQFYRIFLPANVENLIMGKSSSEWING